MHYYNCLIGIRLLDSHKPSGSWSVFTYFDRFPDISGIFELPKILRLFFVGVLIMTRSASQMMRVLLRHYVHQWLSRKY